MLLLKNCKRTFNYAILLSIHSHKLCIVNKYCRSQGKNINITWMLQLATSCFQNLTNYLNGVCMSLSSKPLAIANIFYGACIPCAHANCEGGVEWLEIAYVTGEGVYLFIYLLGLTINVKLQIKTKLNIRHWHWKPSAYRGYIYSLKVIFVLIRTTS